MNKLTPELIEEMLDEFFQYNIRDIYLSAEDESYIFDGDTEPIWDFEGTLCGHHYYIKRGAFKFCLVFDDFDEIIKMNSKGSFTLLCTNNDDETDYEEEINIYDEWDRDFVEDEIEFYKTLNDSVKSFFLPNKFIMDYHGIKIYTQEKIKNTYSESYIPEATRNKLKKEYSIVKTKNEVPETSLDITFVEQIIQSYTNPFEILKVIADVDDLHSSNIGYAYDGRPICHDYGGSDY